MVGVGAPAARVEVRVPGGRLGARPAANSTQAEKSEEEEEAEREGTFAAAPTFADGETPGDDVTLRGEGAAGAPSGEVASDVVVQAQTEVEDLPEAAGGASPSRASYSRRHRRRLWRAREAVSCAATESDVDGREAKGDVELGEIVVHTDTQHNDTSGGDGSPGGKYPKEAGSSEEGEERYCRICMETASVDNLDTDDATQLGCACISGGGL